MVGIKAGAGVGPEGIACGLGAGERFKSGAGEVLASSGLTQLVQTHKISSKLLAFSIFQIVPYQARGFDSVYPVDDMRQVWSALRNRLAR